LVKKSHFHPDPELDYGQISWDPTDCLEVLVGGGGLAPLAGLCYHLTDLTKDTENEIKDFIFKKVQKQEDRNFHKFE